MSHKSTFLILLVTLCIFFTENIYAETNTLSLEEQNELKELSFSLSENLSECAGMLKSASWLLLKLEKIEAHKEFENLYRGWHFAAVKTAIDGGALKEYAAAEEHSNNIVNHIVQRYKAQSELDPSNLIENLTTDFENKCDSYKQYQENLVVDAKRALSQSK